MLALIYSVVGTVLNRLYAFYFFIFFTQNLACYVLLLFPVFYGETDKQGRNLGPSDPPELEFITSLGFSVVESQLSHCTHSCFAKANFNNNGKNEKSVQFLFPFSILMSFFHSFQQVYIALYRGV